MAKRKEKKVRLQSTESHYYYTTDRKPGPVKLEFMKYDPVVRKHVLFKEAKLAKAA